jgi:hypothetical protein
MRVSGMSKHDWDGIRAAYESGLGTVAGIANEFSVSAASIYKRIEREGWRTRHSRGKLRDRKAMLKRLDGLVTREMDALEEIAASTDGKASLAERERLAKVAAGLIKLTETISVLERELNKTARAVGGLDEDKEEDDNALRQGLAKRISELCRQCTPGSSAGKSEPE